MRTRRIRAGYGDRIEACARSAALFHLIFDFRGDIGFRHVGTEQGKHRGKSLVRDRLCDAHKLHFPLGLVFGKRSDGPAHRNKPARRKFLFEPFQSGNGEQVVLKTDCFNPFFRNDPADLLISAADGDMAADSFRLRRLYIAEIRKQIGVFLCHKDKSVRKQELGKIKTGFLIGRDKRVHSVRKMRPKCFDFCHMILLYLSSVSSQTVYTRIIEKTA